VSVKLFAGDVEVYFEVATVNDVTRLRSAL